MSEIKPKLAILLFALLSLAAKGDSLSRWECKEIGYYFAVSDAGMYYAGVCQNGDPHMTLDLKLRCKGMAELVGVLGKELSWRMDHPVFEQVCSDE